MRTIKFRGKILGTNAWIFGNLIQYENRSPEIINKYKFVVKSDTIGQFTGLLDKNGKEIYEGDIINMHTKSYGDEIFIIAYEDSHLGAFALCEGDVYSRFVCVFGKDFGYEPFYCEVIGNIHDNPELLKNND